jgi:predicted NAD-dependent protein-ADP-ribosyltransferase YbiA (DUF1768 family)
MCTREQREPEGVGILLDHRRDDLLWGLMKSGVDDLKSRITQGSGNHLGSTIMTIKTRLGNDYSIGTFHEAKL